MCLCLTPSSPHCSLPLRDVVSDVVECLSVPAAEPAEDREESMDERPISCLRSVAGIAKTVPRYEPIGAAFSLAGGDRPDEYPATGAELPDSPVVCGREEEENESWKSTARTRCAIRLIICDWVMNDH